MSEENLTTLFDRLTPHFLRRDLSLIKLAYQLAKYNHRWQTRKQTDEHGEPIRYFEHLRGVTLILLDEIGCYWPDMVIAALMHDTLEDTKNVNDTDLEVWFGIYGLEVSRIVRLLSKVPKDGYLERLDTFGDWKVRLIKACDRLHNLRSLAGTEPNFQHKIADETREHYIHLLGEMLQTMPERYLPGALKIMDEIEQLTNFYLNDNCWLPDKIPEHHKRRYQAYR
ncbi:MAG: HD domain-containing protein [Patescibacteria group bacterium]